MPEIRVPGPDDHRDSSPSPYCGRLDDHEPHPTRFGPGREYICPGPPTITRAEKNHVNASIERANRKKDQ